MEGRSIPENVIDFYQPILRWIDEYAQNPLPETLVHMKFEYFNTSSSKRIFDIMKKPVENFRFFRHVKKMCRKFLIFSTCLLRNNYISEVKSKFLNKRNKGSLIK
jgi:hypothetical protein